MVRRVSHFWAGVSLVLRQRVRRTLQRDLVGMIVLLLFLFGISGLLEVQPEFHRHTLPGVGASSVMRQPFWVGTPFYLNSVADFTSRWLLIYLFLTSVLFLPLATLLGARTVPAYPEAGAIADTLLTRLNAYQITLGRLIASLGPLLGALTVSLGFWLVAGLFGHSAQGYQIYASRVGAIVLSHLVLGCAVFMIGAVSALGASRTVPGSWWLLGATVGMVLALFCLGGIVLLDPTVGHFENPVPWINTLLLVNPVAAMSGALKVDVLRATWLYQHTQSHDYPFAYPHPLLTCGTYTLVGGCAVVVAGRRLRRAYREDRTGNQESRKLGKVKKLGKEEGS